MDKAEIPFLSASQLSELIKNRSVSPVEAVEAYLDRIDALNGRLYAYLTVTREEAMQDAHESGLALDRGEYRGPMHGVPVAVKDQLNTSGIRTTSGTPIFGDFVPDEDATVVAKLKAAGAILLGKLNMTEFGTTSLSHAFDTARNPWDLERFTGGSSSGSGGATAAFLCAASLGEDTGGSVRGPASWCGLVGLRPTWGRVSRHGLRPGMWSMDTVGPITRTVEDCAITLQAIAGHDPKDPYTWDVPVPDYRAALDGNLAGKKIGVIKELLYADVVEPEVRDAVSNAANALAELGAHVEEISIPLTSHSNTISTVLRVEAPTNYRELIRNRLQEINHDNRIAYLTWSLTPGLAYYKALKLRALLRQQVLDALTEMDVLLMPTMGIAAPKIEPDPVIDSKEKTNRNRSGLTTSFSLASSPAVSICCGFTSENLPIGLQIGGKPFDEQTVLNVAYAYQQSTDWHTRRPPI
ncbi:MAG: Asp-tRNA(Asn)/Glu-tRNA(Gln) amidotransferase GatCAB subunit A [Chloroflexi bacterium]|nr:Asp-tRNA(Asn)/Glu-tRNA(Gln) amidotransferase GatCAB subunit A [Chloroflexota bacterium]MCI0859615.1 Asp-tRNA(Asn)/Glu-tRNA(Gln) amidotransferase GatCAB subunit A [Chloroflexota bacterium]